MSPATRAADQLDRAARIRARTGKPATAPSMRQLARAARNLRAMPR